MLNIIDSTIAFTIFDQVQRFFKSHSYTDILLFLITIYVTLTTNI